MVAELVPASRELGVAWALVPQCWSPVLSPDGSEVAYVSDRSGFPQAYVQPVADPGTTREADAGPAARLLPIGNDHVLSVSWSADGAWIACLGARKGDATRTRVWVVRPDGRDAHRVAGVRQGTASLGPWSHRGSWLALATSGRRPEETSSHLLDPGSGTVQALAYGSPLSVIALDHPGERALVRTGPRGARELVVVDLATGDSVPLMSPEEGAGTTEAGGFAPDGTVYARTDVGRPRAVLVRVRVDAEPAPHAHGHRIHRHGHTHHVHPNPCPEVVAERTDGELDLFTLSEDGTRVVLVWNVAGRSIVELLDTATGRHLDLPPLPGDVVDAAAFSRDGRHLVLGVQGTALPRSAWLVDLVPGGPIRTTWSRVDRPAAMLPAPDALVRPEAVHLVAHDGLPLSGWLYRAPGAVRPGPLALWLHGGPEAEERPTYVPLMQALCERGISVFAPNVRGSTGFGRAFSHADDVGGRFGAIEDVASCVHHLVSLGVADPAAVACTGRSYGGYLTLAALTFHPDLFAAGVDICGMSDLATFMATTEPWIAAVSKTKYGDPDRDMELLETLSPLRRVDRLRAPLLVVHGAYDRNVPVSESDQIVAALRARGAPVDVLLFPDEGHEIGRPANRALFVRTVVDFLSVHLLLGRAAREPEGAA